MVKFRRLKTDKKMMRLLYAFHPSPFGKCLIAVTEIDKAVAYLGFVDSTEEEALKILNSEWPHSATSQDSFNETKSIVKTIFGNSDASSSDSVCVLLKGTDFQVQVWESLVAIPKGTSITYAEVARMIDNPKATRAVGRAISKNRVAYIVPCHRVRGQIINKYKWGVKQKEAILELERE